MHPDAGQMLGWKEEHSLEQGPAHIVESVHGVDCPCSVYQLQSGTVLRPRDKASGRDVMVIACLCRGDREQQPVCICKWRQDPVALPIV